MGVRLGNGNWAVKTSKLLAYNDASGMFFNKEFNFTRATTATRVNKSGLIESVASNLPRIDFLNDSKGYLLLEPASTNLVTYSEDFTHSSYSNQNVTLTNNSGISPQGLNNATLINEGAADSVHWLQPVGIVPNNANVTISFFAKKVTRGFVTVNIYSGVDSKFIRYNIENGSVVNSQSGVTTSVEDFGNGWFRCSYTRETAATGNPNTVVGLSNGSAQGYVGENKEILFWGLQLEQQSFATSYIPTSGSSVTRNADVCNSSGAAQDFDSTEGVLYAEVAKLDIAATEGGLRLSKDANNEIRINLALNNRLNIFVNVGGVNQVYLDNSTFILSNFNKIALKYKLNDYDIYFNGSKVHTDTSALVPSGLDELKFNAFFGKVREVRTYRTALTDAELIALTT